MRQKPNSPPPTRHPKIAWNDGEFVVTLPLPDNQEMRGELEAHHDIGDSRPRGGHEGMERRIRDTIEQLQHHRP